MAERQPRVGLDSPARQVTSKTRSARLLREKLVCACCVGFSVDAQMAALRRHALKNVLQNSGRRDIAKKIREKGLGRNLELYQ